MLKGRISQKQSLKDVLGTKRSKNLRKNKKIKTMLKGRISQKQSLKDVLGTKRSKNLRKNKKIKT